MNCFLVLMSRLVLALIIVAVTPCGAEAQANDQLLSPLAGLASSKSLLEGKALRLKTCGPRLTTARLQKSIALYENAQTNINSRIEAWLFVLRSTRKPSIETVVELEQLKSAFGKVEAFVHSADSALLSTACVRRMAWKEVGAALLAIGPIAVEALGRLLTTEDELFKGELIRHLTGLRVRPWESLADGVAFRVEHLNVAHKVGLSPHQQLELLQLPSGRLKALDQSTVLVSRLTVPADMEVDDDMQLLVPLHLQSAFLAVAASTYLARMDVDEGAAARRTVGNKGDASRLFGTDSKSRTTTSNRVLSPHSREPKLEKAVETRDRRRSD